MKRIDLRRCVSTGLGAAILALGALSPAPAIAAAAPNGGTATPVLVDLSNVQQNGAIQEGAATFRHPGGQAMLDQQRDQARVNAPTSGIQAAPAAALAPVVALGFDGISDAESFCNCLPPDGAIGVGPNHVVAAVNTAFKIWNKSGVLVRASTSLSSLFSAQPACLANISDPSSQYDPSSGGHFILEALTYNASYTSSICIAVSTTSDPTGSYLVYGFAGPTADLLDFPQLAIGSDAIYVAVNVFPKALTFTGARVYAYNKAQMYVGAVASFVVKNVGNDAAGFIADSLYPAKGVTVANTAYFLGVENNFATGNNISLWTWTSPFGANTFTLNGGVTVTTYSQPPKAVEPGGTTDTGDVRNLGAAYYNGTVYGAHTTGCNPGGGTVACVQWYQLANITGAPSLSQQGILGSSGQHRYYPNLSADSSGDIVLGYAYASSTEYPGVRITGRLATDPLNTLQAEAVAKAGEAFIVGSRYGDYAGQQVDPDGCTVWHLEEYAKAGAFWGTWIASTKFAGCGGPPPTPDFSLSATPSSQTVTQGAGTSYAVNITRTNFTGAVTLSAAGLPVGASATFSPNNTTGNTSTMSVTTSSTTPLGSSVLTITGVSGTLSRTTTVTLVVQSAPTPDFSLSATPSSQTVTQGAGTSYAVNITRTNFTGAVTLSASGLPAGASATFSPNNTTGNTSTMSVTTSTGTPTGTFVLTITAVSGSLSRTTTVTLIVQPASGCQGQCEG